MCQIELIYQFDTLLTDQKSEVIKMLFDKLNIKKLSRKELVILLQSMNFYIEQIHGYDTPTPLDVILDKIEERIQEYDNKTIN